jgi:hypothetical protein
MSGPPRGRDERIWKLFPGRIYVRHHYKRLLWNGAKGRLVAATPGEEIRASRFGIRRAFPVCEHRHTAHSAHTEENAMYLLIFGFIGSVTLISLINLFKRVQTKAEISSASREEQQMIAAAREKAWRENKQTFLH